jgi:hypothetical protein
MSKDENENPTHEQVWKTLSKINVNEHTETKMNLTYLSWAWAWKILKDNYPNAKYAFTSHDYMNGLLDYMKYPDESGSVACTIYIGKHVKESMWLPIMDNRNNAIKNPNARQISDAKMRCLVKCISMLGLGLYIYAGEDLPEDTEPEPVKEAPKKKAARKKREQEGHEEEDKVTMTFTEFVKEADSVESLHTFFRDNRSVIDKIEVSNPEEHAKIMAAFSQRKKELAS